MNKNLKHIIESPQESIKYFCKKFKKVAWINFSENTQGDRGIKLRISERSNHGKKRIVYMQIIEREGLTSYSVLQEDKNKMVEPIIISGTFNKLYKHQRIEKSRRSQIELYVLEQAIKENQKKIESYLEAKLKF